MFPEAHVNHRSEHLALVKASQQYFQGPLPPADQFTRYDAVLPGAADRILAMAESNLRWQASVQETLAKSEATATLRVSLGFAFAPYAMAVVAPSCNRRQRSARRQKRCTSSNRTSQALVSRGSGGATFRSRAPSPMLTTRATSAAIPMPHSPMPPTPDTVSRSAPSRSSTEGISS